MMGRSWILRQHRLAAAALGWTAIFAALGPGSASATAAVARTGGVRSITSTSAVLNGVVSTSGIETAWAFQYGTTKTYNHLKPNPVKVIAPGNGVFAVSATVEGLAPSTTYHFRLGAVQGSYPATFFAGADMTFRTLAKKGAPVYGTASLLSSRVAVVRGVALVRFRCAGSPGAKCTGKVSLSGRGRFGNRFRTVGCGTATLRASAGGKQTVRAGVPDGCRSLLGKAHGRFGAKLKVTFSTHQGQLKASVTLVGG